jgi:chromosome segregation ATPase
VQTDIKKKYFEFLENTPDFVPEPGDIVVWKQSYNNGSGHTAVATGKGNKSTFEATSQNDPTGRETHTRTYTYAHIAGFLRYKTDQDQVTPYVSTQTSYQQLRQTWRELYDGEELSVSAIKKQKAERDGLYQNYQKALKDNERLSTIMSDNKTKSDQRIASLEKDISRLQNDLLNAQEQYTACKTALKKKHEEVDIEKEIAPFRTRIVELENKLKEAEENAREWEKMYHEKPAHVTPVRPEPKNMVASFFYSLFEFFNK